MKTIHKISHFSPVDYAAEELKKYIRMMMPDGGDVAIDCDGGATGGFRLGLMQDFGIDVSDVKNVELDDVIYIKAGADGGIIAGSNPRSVLIAVYEYLRHNGCRWLFPGPDGEYIPEKGLDPVEYRHTASARYRGNCIEGALDQQVMLDYIEFMPKLGLNTFMIQFKNPHTFYTRYYNHPENSKYYPAEDVTKRTTIAWTRAVECEMSRRGLLLHAIGHGWTVDPFGIDSSDAWSKVDDSLVPEETRKYLALIGGKRGLWYNSPINTQVCMSNPEVREKMAEYIAEYAENHSNVDFLHVWLADATNNHCECEECKKKMPSDWYVMLLNEIDAALSRRGLSTRIVFIAYTDTMWAPIAERLNNSERFTLMIAPISRNYAEGFDAEAEVKLRPYVRNKAVYARGLEEFIGYFREWQKVWDGASFVFEYHFWRSHNFDVSGLKIAERIYDDVMAYKNNGFDGVIECGTQRSFYPHGFAFYTHARALYDYSTSFEELRDDYFTHLYGEAKDEVLGYLYELESNMPYKWLAPALIHGLASEEMAESVTHVKDVTARGREIIKKYYNASERVQTAAIRLLEKHADSTDGVAEILHHRALGNYDEANECHKKWVDSISEYDNILKTCFDFHQHTVMIDVLINRSKNADLTQS